MEKISIDETSLKFIYFDEEQKLQSCWVLLVHVEVENSLKRAISKEHYGINLCSNLFFIILRSLDIFKCKKNIFRCEEILKNYDFNYPPILMKIGQKTGFLPVLSNMLDNCQW